MYWTKFLHLLFGVTFFGGFIASFFYVQACESESFIAKDFTHKLARTIDHFVFLPMIIVAMITGLSMVHYKGFTFATPWIVVAYSALIVVFFLVVVSAKNKNNKKLFITVNSIVIFILAIIVHDAVMKETIFKLFF